MNSRPVPSNVTYTQNGHYAIHQGEERYSHGAGSIFAQTAPHQAPEPHGGPSRSPSHYTSTQTGGDYARYQYGRTYPDCLHNAEEIMHGQLFEPGGIRSRERLTGARLGYSDEENQAIAARARQSNPYGRSGYRRADPQPGQAYGIIPQNDGRAGVANPYHFAPVVAADGYHRVTAEQDAANLSESQVGQRSHYPVMDMYRVDRQAGSFEQRYATPAGYGRTAATIVAEPYEDPASDSDSHASDSHPSNPYGSYSAPPQEDYSLRRSNRHR